MHLSVGVLLAQLAVPTQQARPVLEFPEPGLDDTAAYQGYRTRFFKDAVGNAVQIYLNQRDGRIVHLWADAANASAGFTARDAGGRPARLAWGSDGTVVGVSGAVRSVEYRLSVDSGPLELGRFLLGSMRLERDFQYQQGHLRPFEAPGIEQPELVALIAHLERLDPEQRREHLRRLNATTVEELRARLRPTLRRTGTVLLVEQTTFDGRNRLSLEITALDGEMTLDAGRGAVAVRPAGAGPLTLGIRITTDAPALRPLLAEQIFNPEFLRFHRGLREARDPRFARVDRQIRSAELVSYEEKLMAGLPNYATYFGRDMIMSALMLEPVWNPAMLEHVIASVLRKLTPDGQVSHEEALGGQAIRENAGEYDAIMERAEDAGRRGDRAAADSLRRQAGAMLEDLQRVRENYHMVDDDFQFPVLVARYLANQSIAPDRKRAFLRAADGPRAEARLTGLLRNLAFVADRAAPYAREPVGRNLVSFARRPDGSWSSSSWRDSNAGYAGGRYAMDVNVVWVPGALAATQAILAELVRLGWGPDSVVTLMPGPAGSAFRGYVLDSEALSAALRAWSGARRHFQVDLPAAQVTARLQSWLARLPEAERAYWSAQSRPASSDGLHFLALSADSAARPIPVMSTDPAMSWFLDDVTGQVVSGQRTPREALAELEPFLAPYPRGLFVSRVGPVVANDALASAEIQQAFRADQYHSPLVVWGREVNLLMLGLTRQLTAAYDSHGQLRSSALGDYAAALARALAQTLTAVDASGLKHSELWSYRIEGGRLLPVRYGVSTDIQLWSLTDLAVQYSLERLPAPAAALLRQAMP